MKGLHVCSFEAVDLPKGRRLIYATFRAAVLKAGRFSVFEATETQKRAQLFTDLCRDPDVICTPDGYPWTRVELRPAGARPTQETPE